MYSIFYGFKVKIQETFDTIKERKTVLSVQKSRVENDSEGKRMLNS